MPFSLNESPVYSPGGWHLICTSKENPGSGLRGSVWLWVISSGACLKRCPACAVGLSKQCPSGQEYARRKRAHESPRPRGPRIEASEALGRGFACSNTVDVQATPFDFQVPTARDRTALSATRLMGGPDRAGQVRCLVARAALGCGGCAGQVSEVSTCVAAAALGFDLDRLGCSPRDCHGLVQRWSVVSVVRVNCQLWL